MVKSTLEHLKICKPWNWNLCYGDQGAHIKAAIKEIEALQRGTDNDKNTIENLRNLNAKFDAFAVHVISLLGLAGEYGALDIEDKHAVVSEAVHALQAKCEKMEAVVEAAKNYREPQTLSLWLKLTDALDRLEQIEKGGE